MKIPKTVKIGWRNYTVKLVEDLQDDNGIPLNGQTDFTNHIINIEKHIQENEKLVTFLHEVQHCIYHAQGNCYWRDDEVLVSANAEGLFQLMKDNPKVFEG